jgi:hypothetical protein
VTVRLDEREILRWQGPQRGLNLVPDWEPADSRMMGLALGDADVTVEQLDYTPLDSEARVLEPPPDQRIPLPPGATRVAASENIDLLPLLDLEHGVFDGEVKRTPQGIQLSAPPRQHSRLAVPVWPRGAYELHCEFTPSTQEMAVGIVIPTDHSRATVFPLRAERFVGMGKIKTHPPEHPENPTRTKAGRVTAGRRHSLLIRVMPTRTESEITVLLDDQPFFSWTGSDQDLSLAPDWDSPHQKIIALGCNGGSATCHALRLKMLSGEAWILVPRPATANP